MHFARRADIVIGLVLLEDAPHHLGILGSIAPVALGIEVPEEKRLLFPFANVSGCPGDLPGDKGFSSAGRLVIEKDPIRGMKVVGLPVIHHGPVGIEFRDSVRGSRIKGRRLALRHFLDLAVEFTGRGLVEPDLALEPDLLDRIQEAKSADGIDLGGVFGYFEGNLDVALRSEVVDFVGSDFLEKAVQV